MKTNFRTIAASIFLSAFCYCSSIAQPFNQAANPMVSGVFWNKNPMVLGESSTVEFKFGNTGSDPIPAETAQWTINIPLSRVSVQDGPPIFSPPLGTATTGLYEFNRFVSGSTLVIVLRSHTAIPASTALAPQDEYRAIYTVKGTITGGPVNATINAARVSGQLVNVGNLDAGDDNASASIEVTTTLPVTLLLFEGTVANCKTTLNWATAIEAGFKNFVLQYSSDGVLFSNIETIAAKGDNSSYGAWYQALSGKTYYRLKIVDLNGTFVYSKIIVLNVHCDKNNTLIYPNPSTTVVNITIDGITPGKKTAVLFDAAGRVMLTQALANGSNQLNVSGIRAGMYSLVVQNGNLPKEIHKLIVQK